jgi:hypothetical protein
MKENLNVATQFCDYASGGEVTDVQQIKPGTGGIIRDGIQKLAVYRDLEGKLHTCSRCVLTSGASWIGTTWKIPGIALAMGRDSTHLGKVLNGPANHGLEPVE